MKAVQDGAKNVVSVMDASKSKSQDVLELAQKTAAAYSEIARGIAAVRDRNADIAAGAETQSSIATQVNTSISDMEKLVNNNVTNLSDIKNRTDDQVGMVQELDSLVGTFKVS